MGYINDQQGIFTRYSENRGFWDLHIKNTKEYIINSFKNKNVKSAAILGSGWLLDLPIKEMLNKFNEIYLFDICHPIPIQKKFKNHPIIKIINFDLTGGIAEKIFELSKSIKKGSQFSLNDINFPEIKEFTKYDFVVSLNVINQLNIIIEDYIKKYFLCNDEEIKEFAKNIQSNHLKYLPDNKSCVITDFEEIYIKNNNEYKRENLVYIPLDCYHSIKRWQWHFDMNNNYRKGYNTIFEVIAFEK